jgi:hypothetical protein
MFLKYPALLFILAFSMASPRAHGSQPITRPPLQGDQIPGMDLLVTTIRAMPIHDEEKNKLLSVVLPSKERPYYRLGTDFLDPAERSGLIKKYSELLSIPKDQVTLFAVTNSALRRTVLFPEFYDLKSERAQAALLFHESLWILGVPDYYTIVQAEAALQNYLEHPEDPEVYFNFYYQVSRLFSSGDGPPNNRITRSTAHVLVMAALEFDRTHGSNIVALKTLVGTDFITAWLADPLFVKNSDLHLQMYYLTCCNGGEPEIQSSLFLRALKFFHSLEAQGKSELKGFKEAFPLMRSTTAATPASIATLTNDLVLNRNPTMEDHQMSFPIELGSEQVGLFILFLEK